VRVDSLEPGATFWTLESFEWTCWRVVGRVAGPGWWAQ